MSLGVLGAIESYVVMKCVERSRKLSYVTLSIHINDYNIPLGVLRPLNTYVVMKCIKRGHRLSYDPF